MVDDMIVVYRVRSSVVNSIHYITSLEEAVDKWLSVNHGDGYETYTTVESFELAARTCNECDTRRIVETMDFIDWIREKLTEEMRVYLIIASDKYGNTDTLGVAVPRDNARANKVLESLLNTLDAEVNEYDDLDKLLISDTTLFSIL